MHASPFVDDAGDLALHAENVKGPLRNMVEVSARAEASAVQPGDDEFFGDLAGLANVGECCLCDPRVDLHGSIVMVMDLANGPFGRLADEVDAKREPLLAGRHVANRGEIVIETMALSLPRFAIRLPRLALLVALHAHTIPIFVSDRDRVPILAAENLVEASECDVDGCVLMRDIGLRPTRVAASDQE